MNELFPNDKEITKSIGVFEATKYLPNGYEWNRDDVTVVCVGDGVKPRTTALFVYRTAWNGIAIDPELVPCDYDFKRFRMERCRMEETTLELAGKVLIVLLHSPAKVKDCLDRIKAPTRALITMDCCVNNYSDMPKPDVEYQDGPFWRPINTIRVWREV